MCLTLMQVWQLSVVKHTSSLHYDDDAAIYDDLYTEIKDALAKLNPGGDFVSADLFYGSKCYYSCYCCRRTGGEMEKTRQFVVAKIGNALFQA